MGLASFFYRVGSARWSSLENRTLRPWVQKSSTPTKMLFPLYIFIFFNLVLGTPPACFLNCINNVSRFCGKNQADFKCLCKVHEAVYQCINKHCPGEHFYSSRDHFKGTCIEHGLEFESLDEGPFIDVTEANYALNEDASKLDQTDAVDSSSDESSAEDSEDDCEGPTVSPQGENADDDSSDEWAGENDWEEGKDWPANDDLSLSGLNEDVIKNYMNYVIKNKPLPRPSLAGSRQVIGSGKKSKHIKSPAKRPVIIHGPPSDVSSIAPSDAIPVKYRKKSAEGSRKVRVPNFEGR